MLYFKKKKKERKKKEKNPTPSARLPRFVLCPRSARVRGLLVATAPCGLLKADRRVRCFVCEVREMYTFLRFALACKPPKPNKGKKTNERGKQTNGVCCTFPFFPMMWLLLPFSFFFSFWGLFRCLVIINHRDLNGQTDGGASGT